MFYQVSAITTKSRIIKHYTPQFTNDKYLKKVSVLVQLKKTGTAAHDFLCLGSSPNGLWSLDY